MARNFSLLSGRNLSFENLTGIPFFGFWRDQKFPPCKIPTVGIVWKSPLTPPQQSHKHHHHGGDVFPLLLCDIYGYSQSDAGNLFRRGRARALWLGLI